MLKKADWDRFTWTITAIVMFWQGAVSTNGHGTSTMLAALGVLVLSEARSIRRTIKASSGQPQA